MYKYLFFTLTLLISINSFSQNDYNQWKSYGVKKVEMALANSRDKWEEILIYNPGTQFKIQNEKDLYIDNLDLLSLIVGNDKIGLYKAIRFINGINMNSTEPYTKRYSGRLELLDNYGIASLSGEAVIDFFYYPNNNKLGVVLIANKIGMTKTRLWVSNVSIKWTKKGLN